MELIALVQFNHGVKFSSGAVTTHEIVFTRRAHWLILYAAYYSMKLRAHHLLSSTHQTPTFCRILCLTTWLTDSTLRLLNRPSADCTVCQMDFSLQSSFIVVSECETEY